MGKYTLHFIILFLWGSGVAYCQGPKTDSLHRLLNNAKNERRVEILHELSSSLWYNYPDSAEKYIRQALRLSIQLKDPKLEAISWRLLGGVYNYYGHYDSSVFYSSKAYSLSSIIKDSTLIAICLNNIGWGYYQLGSYPEALENLLRAQSMHKHLTLTKRFSTLTNIGYVYTKLNDFGTARKYFQEAEVASRNDALIKADVLYGMAHTFLLEKKYKEAKQYVISSLQIANNIKNKSWSARAHNVLAQIYYQTNRVDSARLNFKQALSLYTEIRDKSGSSEIFYHLAKMQLVDSNLDSALHYTRLSQKLAKQINSRDRLLENLDQLGKLFMLRKQYDSAIYYQTEYVELNDKKLDENSARNISDVQIKLREIENLKDLTMKDEQLLWKTNLNYYALGILGLVLIIIGALLSFYKAQKRLALQLVAINSEVSNQKSQIELKNDELQKLNIEKNNLIEIVAHDLKSPLNQIKGLISIIRLIPESINDEAKENIDRIEGSAIRLTEMISKILNIEAIESKKINIKLERICVSEIIFEIEKKVKSEAEAKKIKLHSSIPRDVWIEADKEYFIEVIENLLSNAIKFSPYNRKVYINLSKTNGDVLCEVRDEGPGFSDSDKALLFKKYQKLSASPIGSENSPGLGLSIVKTFVEAMNGKIWCISEVDKGASFFIKFPAPQT